MEAKMWTQRKKTEKATNKTEGPRNRSMEGIQSYIISLEKRRVSQKVTSVTPPPLLSRAGLFGHFVYARQSANHVTGRHHGGKTDEA